MSSKKDIQDLLVSMGFEPYQIEKSFEVYERAQFSGHGYNIELMTEIVVKVQRKYEKAIEEHTKAIALHINDCNCYSDRSGCYAAIHKYEEALADGYKCVELKPDWFGGYARVGYALFKLNKLDEAKQAYEDGM